MKQMLRACVRIVAMVALVATPVAAQPDPSRRSKAKALTERGIAKVHAGEYSAAIELYQQAFDLSSEAILLSNIGSAYQSLGELRSALRFFCRYLDAEPTGKLASFAREQANQLATDLGEATPCAKAPVKVATAEVTTERSATQRSAAGSGAAAMSQTGPLPAAMRVSGLVLLTGAGVSLGVGGYYGWVGKRASDVISGNTDEWTDAELRQQAIGERANRRMAIFLIGGGATALTGTVLYFWGRSLARKRRLAIVPWLTPTAPGLAVVGAFR
jgi:tetratricopeptide (TPR) repeat protein